MAKKPLPRPRADSEKATGKPISMISTRPANISGAKVFHLHFFVILILFIEASGVRGSLNRLFVVGVHFELAL